MRDLPPGSDSLEPFQLTTVGSRAYFSSVSPDHGPELWTSDGIHEGTFPLMELPGRGGTALWQLLAVGDTLFFWDQADEDGMRGAYAFHSVSHLDSGVLTITGGNERDIIDVTRKGANIRVSRNSLIESTPRASVTRISLAAGAGNDVITLGPGIPTTFIDAGTGDDRVLADPALAANIYVTGAGGNDTIVGGAGNDELSGANGADRILGGSGHDYLLGGASNDALLGEAGDDILFGGGGKDRLIGDGGSDYLLGGNGNDFIDSAFLFSGTHGTDTLSGNAGIDSAFARLEDIVAGIEILQTT